jgi:phosphopantothenoylcysteine decarboxylase/phosphopantothenate--cysteine ligase
MTNLNEKKKIVLGVTGSIAAYKAAELARLFISWGYEVKVILSSSASQFVGQATFEAITNSSVATDFWNTDQKDGIEHISLADWADLIIIAPATADSIAKIAYGFADTPLLATVLATKAPILIAPAMNVNMYENPVTLENLKKLIQRGINLIDPEEGALACGWNGTGRLADPWEIFQEARRLLTPQDLAGKKVLITTGPTREAIDPVRFISNRSSGKMGVELAREAARRGAQVIVIHGPIEIKVQRSITTIKVESAQDMYQEVIKNSYEAEILPDLIIMTAAVADFKPKNFVSSKIKKSNALKQIELEKNIDILEDLGSRRANSNKDLGANTIKPMLVGFAVETGEVEDLLEEVRKKIKRKSVDMIVGNFAHEAFELDTNRVWIIDSSGKQQELSTTYKSRIAERIFSIIVKSI